MAHGAPDWVRIVQVVVTVNLEPVVPGTATEVSAGDTGKYSGSDTTYQEVASWTISADKVGELKEIMILADDYDHTLIKITVGSDTWCNDWDPQGSMPLVFEDLKLSEAQVVKVEARSDDGTAIEVDAVITGKEIG